MMNEEVKFTSVPIQVGPACKGIGTIKGGTQEIIKER